MRNPRGIPCHQAVPSGQRRVPNITGCAGIDEAIRSNPSKTMADKLQPYLKGADDKGPYSPRTNYDGYSNSGDD